MGTGVRHTAVSDVSALSRLLLTTTPRGGGCCSRSQRVNRGAEPQVTKHLSQGTTLFRGGVDTCSQSRPAPEPACGQPPGSAGRRGRGSPAVVGREEGPALGASVGASGTRTQPEADGETGRPGQGLGRHSRAAGRPRRRDAASSALPLPRPRSAACGHSPSEQGPLPGLGARSQRPGASPVGAATRDPLRERPPTDPQRKPRDAQTPAVAFPGPGPGPRNPGSAGRTPTWKRCGREGAPCGQAQHPGRPFPRERHSRY